MGIEDVARHEQRTQLRPIPACGGQHLQTPGVEIAPVGKLLAVEPWGLQPSEVEAGAEDGDGVGDLGAALAPAARSAASDPYHPVLLRTLRGRDCPLRRRTAHRGIAS